MKASCRFAMAMHILAVLAHQNGGCVSSRSLAASVNTNPVIIRRLLLVLQKAGLIETRKGAGLGSRLSRTADQITLAEVYRAVEGDESFALPRHRPNEACPVGRGILAVLESVFASARAALERDLEKTSLAGFLQAVETSRPRAKAASDLPARQRERSWNASDDILEVLVQ